MRKKKFASLLLIFSLCLMASIPCQAAASAGQNDTTGNRLAGLEAEINRLRISGAFNITGDSFFGSMPGYDSENPQVFPRRSIPGFKQQLDLELNFRAAGNLDFFASAVYAGAWGSGLASDGNIDVPGTGGLPSLEEAYFRYYHPRFLLTAGRQYFSMGPVGLIADNAIAPLDAVVINSVFHNLFLTGIYSRLSSEYYSKTQYVISTDDYQAGRISFPAGPSVIGCNILWSGLSNEQGYSLDVQLQAEKWSLFSEAAFYRPDASFFDAEYAWHPGLVAGLNLFLPKDQFVSITAGFLDKGFMPTFSSAGFSAADGRVKFYNNTAGLDLLYHRSFKSNVTFTAEYVATPFLDKAYATENRQDLNVPNRQVILTAAKQWSAAAKFEVAYRKYLHRDFHYHQISGGVNLKF